MTGKIITTPGEWQRYTAGLMSEKWVIVCDENTEQFCLELFRTNYKHPQKTRTIVISAGENTKTEKTLIHLWNMFSELGLDRQSVVVSLGGGMVTDVAGFAAATFKRGIRTVNIPTTLLAMCDAAIGGKTGINLSGIKNLVGTIQMPQAVLIDTDFLKTLNSAELHNGFAETVKHALIADELLWLEIKQGELDKLCRKKNLILRSANIKRQIVALDLHDKSTRQSLNFGHTIGHAAEAVMLTGNSPWHHGQSVVFGMAAELWLSEKLLDFPDKERIDICAWIAKNYTLPAASSLNTNTCLLRMKQDKKNRDNRVICTLLGTIGNPVTGVPVREDLAMESMEFAKSLFA